MWELSMETTSLLRTVFTNVSQLFYCISLFAVAGIEWRFHQDLGLHWISYPMSYLLAGLTLILLGWSILDCLKNLIAEKHWVVAALMGGIYLSVIGLGASAFPTLILRR
jgi:cytochrome bd-type quinol oxidase subunit 2